MKFSATILNVTIILILVSVTNVVRAVEPCSVVTDNSITTRTGGNETVTEIVRQRVRRIQGSVLVDAISTEGFLVELFDKPEWILTGATRPKQNRLKACFTRQSGNFSFLGLKTGAYEIRISKDHRFNPLHIYVRVDNKRGKNGFRIRARPTLGT